MTAKRKGADFERRCRRDLDGAGWLTVKSSDSKGVADLIALRREAGSSTRVLLIEAKGGRNQYCGPAQWNLLWETAWRIGAEPVLADKAVGIAAPRWWRLTGPKSGRGEAQPRKPFDIEGWAADAV